MDTANVSPVTISKFVTDKKIFALIIWPENSFHMTLFEEEGSWTGLFLPNAVREFANSLNMNIEEYFTQVKLAMVNHSSDYLYEFIAKGSSASFKWIKKEGTVKILHGSIELTKDEPATSKDALIEALLFKNENLERELDDVKKFNHNLNNELTTSRNELKKIASSQSELEKILYGKFVQLLNTKKERIKILEEHLSKYESL